MIWRHLCLARAITATGILTCSMLGFARAGDPSEPVPAATSVVETVQVLAAEKAGILAVEVRGSGPETVRVQLRNQSNHKLRVILPPGLVASNAISQPGGGGGGGGGAFQNMGLGAAGNQAGGFGQFAANQSSPGFRSVAPVDDEDVDAAPGAVVVPVGQTVDLPVPAVCLNYGAPTPINKNRFRLIDVDTYSSDARVRKALRTLATVGTSQGVAQAAMWRVCNNIPFDEMLAGGKGINAAELALAARFVRVLDGVSADVDAPRVCVAVTGDAAIAKDVARINRELDGLRILGMPIQVLAHGDAPVGSGPMLHLGVTLASGDRHETRCKIVVQTGDGVEAMTWSTLGVARADDLPGVTSLNGATLARAIDQAVGSAFVTARVARRSANGTTLEVRNKLPLTVANLTVRAGTSLNAPLVNVAAVGVGPGRTGLFTIPAAMATVDRVELNGL